LFPDEPEACRLAAPGLKLKARLDKVASSLDWVAQKGAVPRRSSQSCAS